MATRVNTSKILMIIYYTGKTIAKVEKPGFNMINQEWRAFYLLTLHDLFFDFNTFYTIWIFIRGTS